MGQRYECPLCRQVTVLDTIQQQQLTTVYALIPEASASNNKQNEQNKQVFWCCFVLLYLIDLTGP